MQERNDYDNRSRWNEERDRNENRNRWSRERDDDRGFFDRVRDQVKDFSRRDRDYDDRDRDYGRGRYEGRYEDWALGGRDTYGMGGQNRDYGASDRESDYSFRRGESRGGDIWTERGRFRGKGPRNFKRSDDRILEDVCRQLEDHDSIDASNLDVTVNNCEVTLKGTAENRKDKRLAEEIAEGVWGVKDVRNEIRVQSRENLTDRGQQTRGQRVQIVGKKAKAA
jgi:osmotically-inducible protein OsmY